MGETLLERYEIRERIAAGGMSVVYSAQDVRLCRSVCVKVFHGLDFTRSEYRASYDHFVQEAFALSQLQHPNTLRIYDFGYLPFAPKSPFHVSELMNGGTLLQWVRNEGPLRSREALAVLEPVFHALAEAHARRIVHRDIKPSNILFANVGPNRIPKLADFGSAMAQLSDDDPSFPQRVSARTGSKKVAWFFSPGWGAPEQLGARDDEIGPSTDVFSLGLVVAFILSGKRVFVREDLQSAARARESDSAVSSAIATLALPGPIEDVIFRACRVRADERFRSANAFLLALRGALEAAERESAPPPVPTEGSTQSSPAMARGATPPQAAPSAPAGTPPPVAADASTTQEMLQLDAVVGGSAQVGGREVVLVSVPASADLGGGTAGVRSAARLRASFIRAGGGTCHLHLRGLNCFAAKDGGRPSSAVELSGDGQVELYSAGRERMDAVRCVIGSPAGADALCLKLPEVTVTVMANHLQHAALLDFGPGRELALLFRSTS